MNGDLVGRQIGDLQILRRLGRGGMAEVYAARQLSLQREVAIKVLLDELCRDQAYVRRFRREALAAAKLNHANIVMILDVGELPALDSQSLPRPYIVQELITGENLRETLSRTGAMSEENVREVLLAVASALDVSSAAGITHRDIKPENILQSDAGAIKIADFGLARLKLNEQSGQMDLTADGLALGTPRYMSPEQIQGKPVDVRSDLYSLGVTAYHLASGEPPFTADDPVALAVKHLHETHPSIESVRAANGDGESISQDLCQIIDRLMAKSPQSRFQTPVELIRSLGFDGSAASRSAVTHRDHLTRRLTELSKIQRKQQRRSRLITIASVVAAMIGLAASFVWFRQQSRFEVLATLRPSAVPVQSTIEEQFLLAISRNDVPGWAAVGQHFGDSKDPDDQLRVIESQIQLSRVLGRDGQHREQIRVLGDTVQDGGASRLQRVVALATLEPLVDDNQQRISIRDDCARQFGELADLSPSDAKVAWSLIPESLRLKMDLKPPR